MLFLALECENRKHLLHAYQEELLKAADRPLQRGICTVAFCLQKLRFVPRSTELQGLGEIV